MDASQSPAQRRLARTAAALATGAQMPAPWAQLGRSRAATRALVGASSAPARRPNICFVLTDDQGYGELGCHGNTVIQTPAIDQLHADAVRFTDFHVGTTCAPTRAGLLTGHFCNSAGVWHTIGGRSLLREDEWTLPTALSGAGYRCAHYGKWHLGDAAPFRAFERGFEVSIAHAGGGIGNTPDGWGNDYFDDIYQVNGVPKRFKGYCTDVFFEEAMSFATAHKDEPFFTYIACNAPHSPFNVANRYSDRYTEATAYLGEDASDRANFYGMVTCIDDNVQRMRDHLHDLGVLEDTIFIFMTDNGSGGGVTMGSDSFVEESPCNFNCGMRGIKVSPYEGGHRVPFIFSYPRLLQQHQGAVGRDVDTLTSYVDFMPTMLELCGVAEQPPRPFHGQSLVPFLKDEQEASAATLDFADRCMVTDTQRVPRPVKWRNSCVMRGKLRMIDGKELYDLSSDPGQKQDISDSAPPELLTELRQAYEEWWELVSEQFDRDISFALPMEPQQGDRMLLTTHDIRNEAGDAVWNQGEVRAGKAVAGYWAVDVRKAGRYTIELRRWPAETGYALSAGIDGDDVPWNREDIDEKEEHFYSGGEALDLRWAQLSIGGHDYQAELEQEGSFASFTVQLELGEDQLFAAFYGRGGAVVAPYYIYIAKEADEATGGHKP